VETTTPNTSSVAPADVSPVTVVRKARADRAPSWRQLYRIAMTLSELAGLEAPNSAAAASALIGKLETLQSGAPTDAPTDAELGL
jgi:hypothetical protein